jgi:excisionase family DNA binding protein
MSTVENLELWTVGEVAQILRVSRPTVYRLVESGELPAHRIGGSIRIGRDDLLAVISKPIRVEEPE